MYYGSKTNKVKPETLWSWYAYDNETEYFPWLRGPNSAYCAQESVSLLLKLKSFTLFLDLVVWNKIAKKVFVQV